MVNVPSSFVGLLQSMSAATGIPYSVEAAQANEESGFNATAVSSTGAEGWLQFEPGTYQAYAGQAGVGANTEFNPADEAKVYDVYMSALLQQEGGNLRNALAAYNAGPGNLSAGYGYADAILSAAGQSANTTVSGSQTPTAASLTGLSIPGIPSVSGLVGDALNGIASALGLKTGFKDLIERFGLIILGFTLVIVGIHILSTGTGSQAINITTESAEGPEGSTSTRKIKTPVSRHTKTVTKAAGTTGAEDAVEAAAIA